MTRQEYEAKLADLQSQIEELKQAEIEEDSPKPPHPRWKPEIGQIYYHVYRGDDLWYGFEQDYNSYAVGDVFKTRSEAEFIAERLKVITEMREWEGNYDDLWRIYYDDNEVSAQHFSPITFHYGEMRFATEEDAKNCINAVGADRIKKYYFMIPEDKA